MFGVCLVADMLPLSGWEVGGGRFSGWVCSWGGGAGARRRRGEAALIVDLPDEDGRLVAIGGGVELSPVAEEEVDATEGSGSGEVSDMDADAGSGFRWAGCTPRSPINGAVVARVKISSFDGFREIC